MVRRRDGKGGSGKGSGEEEEEKLNRIMVLEAILEISRARLGDYTCKQNCWGSRKENYNRQHC